MTASLDRREALEGAGYVINSIQVGGHAATVRDQEIPARYGVRQTIGDTLGIGGIIRTLRTAPVMLGIGNDMAEVCPGAWLLNYTNPMAMICQLVYQGTPQTAGRGALPLGAGHHGDDRRPVRRARRGGHVLRRGINHQTFLYRLEHGGESLYPKLDEAIERNPDLLRRVRVDMYRRLGYFPTESSEHSAEYSPWYMRHDSQIERFRIPVADYIGRSAEGLEEYERVKREIATGEPLEIERSWEYASLIINSIETGEPCVIYGNVRNTGLITNLPADICVEVPCLVDRTGVNPDARRRGRAAVRGAQPHVLERLRPDGARRARGPARPRAPRRDARSRTRRRPSRSTRSTRSWPSCSRPIATCCRSRCAETSTTQLPPSSSPTAIDAAEHEGPAVVVAIDGPGGAGKSTLARELALLRDDVAIIEGDDFYRPLTESTRAALTPLEAVDLLFDWERLRDEALAPLLRGEEARYRRYDWAAGRLGEDVATRRRSRRRGGRGLLRRAARAARLLDLIVVVDAPRELCLARQLARGEDEPEQIARWRAAEDWYFERQDPRRVADLVIDGS